MKPREDPNLPKNSQPPQFMRDYNNLTQILTDRKLAQLGDAYINFVYSLVLSQKKGKPSGTKVKGTALAEALRKAGLRKHLPSRIDKHVLSDAAEALVVYAWLHKLLTLEDSVETLEKTGTLVEGLTQLLLKVKEKIKLSELFPIPY
jgi:Ribonuclease III